jgi:phage terminase large subunit-like protein
MVAAPVCVEPVRHGPQGWPKHTLGWEAADWASRHLLQPDRLVAGKPWVFTEEQMRFLAWFYAVDEHGDWLYRYSVLRRMKGWGKDPLAAVMASIEFVGPCRFGGWKADGEPEVVAQPSSWVQIAAVSKEQTRNTMVLFPSLFSKETIAEYSIDIGKEILYARGGAQIQAVTSSPRTLEGNRSTFVILNESQHWLENNDGIEMADAAGRNTAKTGGRLLAITNAHRIGEGSVAERDWLAYQAKGDASGILYDSVEAPEDTDIADDESLRAGLMAARGDSDWVPVDRLMLEMRDERYTEVYRRRFYLNQIRVETNTWITADEWKAAERMEEVPEGTLITLGFDGSRWRDTTALVGTVVKTGYQWVIGVWERPAGVTEWEVPEDEVNLAVESAFAKYDVWRFYCDPYWWEETIARWAGAHGSDKVVFFHTNSQMTRLTRVLKAYETAVRTKEQGHEASETFAEHIAHSVKREVNLKDEDGEKLYLIQKENKNSPRKIDVAMAAVLSWGARIDAIASGATDGSGAVEVWFLNE